ncbi:zinc transport system permease protein [Hydrogenivirga caldilitoris]|uniref:Zinc transport system permease protein n=1 Tax=Hydrogenivirga caldilitoris TaxID=246264 RepID=A0A497XP98_9AQUI|nr:metal ABC transporter permease [Hydrogenivirga caldilitoris]RLJ70765.1 zinc transport system permease protein [Hydrogenivirga caldilitoris]
MELLSYDFVQRGILTGVTVGIVSAIAGVFLILRRMSFLGAGLSHAAFGGIALSMLLGVEPFLFTSIFTILVGNLVQVLIYHRRVPGDAAIALVFSGGVALAVLILGIVKGFGEYIFSYLFGNILIVTREELYFSLVSSALVLLFFIVFYKKLVLLSFSEELAKLKGVNLTLMNHLLVSVSSLVIVMAIKAVGIILASSMIVIPALTALLMGSSFLSAVIVSTGVSLVSVVAGIALAFYYDLPPSGTIVGAMIFLFGLAFLRRAFSS